MRRRTLLSAIALLGSGTVAGCGRPPWREGVPAESIADVTFREAFDPEHDDAFDRLTDRDRPLVETVHEIADLPHESPPTIVIRGRIVGQHPSCFAVTLRRAELIDDVLEVLVTGQVIEEPCADVAVPHPFEVEFVFDSPDDTPESVELVGFGE